SKHKCCLRTPRQPPVLRIDMRLPRSRLSVFDACLSSFSSVNCPFESDHRFRRLRPMPTERPRRRGPPRGPTIRTIWLPQTVLITETHRSPKLSCTYWHA